MRAESQRLLALARLEIDARLASGDIAGALDTGRAALARDQPSDPRYLWPLLAAAMRACAEASAGRPPPGASDPVRLREDLEHRAGSISRPGPVHEAWAALAQPEQEAYALLRAASAASAAGAASSARRGRAVRAHRT